MWGKKLRSFIHIFTVLSSFSMRCDVIYRSSQLRKHTVYPSIPLRCIWQLGSNSSKNKLLDWLRIGRHVPAPVAPVTLVPLLPPPFPPEGQGLGGGSEKAGEKPGLLLYSER